MNRLILLSRILFLVLLLQGRSAFANEYMGLLVIKVDISGRSSTDDYVGETYIRGHAWLELRWGANLEYRVTVGTWGNTEPVGVHQNMEWYEHSDAGRAVYLTWEQFEVLSQKYSDYVDLGKNAWGRWENCTYFATDLWNSVTGENIDNRLRLWDDIGVADVVQGVVGGPAPNPTSVYYSIVAWNGGYSFNSWDWHSRQNVPTWIFGG